MGRPLPECLRQRVDDVGGGEGDLSQPASGQVAGETVNVHAKHSGLQSRHALSDEGAEDAG